jgi:hypothetical protein
MERGLLAQVPMLGTADIRAMSRGEWEFTVFGQQIQLYGGLVKVQSTVRFTPPELHLHKPKHVTMAN